MELCLAFLGSARYIDLKYKQTVAKDSKPGCDTACSFLDTPLLPRFQHPLCFMQTIPLILQLTALSAVSGKCRHVLAFGVVVMELGVASRLGP